MGNAESFNYVDWNQLNGDQIQDWIESSQEASLGAGEGRFTFGLELKSSNKLIGAINLYWETANSRQGGFGILIINPLFRRQGYGAETLGGALHFGFDAMKWRRVVAGVDSRNASARKLLENSAMRREGEFIKDVFLKGEWVNTIWYAMLAEEFPRANDASGGGVVGVIH